MSYSRCLYGDTYHMRRVPALWEGHDVLCRHSHHSVFLLKPQSLVRKGKVGIEKCAQCTMYPCMKRRFLHLQSLCSLRHCYLLHTVSTFSHTSRNCAPPHSYRTDSGKFVLWAPVGCACQGRNEDSGVAAESTPTHPSASHLLSLRSPYAETETNMLSEAKTD